MLENEHVTRLNFCVGCGADLDRATGLNHDRAPSVGAVSLCATCGLVSIFREGLVLTPASKDELKAFGPEVLRKIVILQRAIATRQIRLAPRGSS